MNKAPVVNEIVHEEISEEETVTITKDELETLEDVVDTRRVTETCTTVPGMPGEFWHGADL